MYSETPKAEQSEAVKEALISADIFSAHALAERIRQAKIAKMRSGELLPEVIAAALQMT